MFRASILALSAIALLSASPDRAEAKRKQKGKAAACNLSYLPFVEGMSWKYQYAIPPGVEARAGGLKAKVPDTFTIVVKSVEAKSAGATITLEESYRKVVRQTVLTCDSKGLRVPLESFYFAGELPGALGIQVENLEVEGAMYPGKAGLKRGESFYSDIKAQIVRTAGGDAKVEHPNASLEMERQITVGTRTDVEVEHGIHTAYPVEVALSGRAALAPTPDKQVALPDGIAMLWFAPKLGLVRSYNRLGQGWELVEHTDAAGNPI